MHSFLFVYSFQNEEKYLRHCFKKTKPTTTAFVQHVRNDLASVLSTGWQS